MTSTTNRHPPTKRIAVAELMRESDLTAEAIAVKTGVPYATVCRWNQFHNWRPWFRRTPPAVDPRRWSKPRLAALERVYRQEAVDPGDLAQAVGTDRLRAKAFFRACGFAERVALPEALAGEGTGSLRMSLRRHLTRQIADLDAALTTHRGSPAESARMLRDLAMLKKFVEEVEPVAPQAEAAQDGEVDLKAMRARIWKRMVCIARARRDADVSDDELAEEARAVLVERAAQGYLGAAESARVRASAIASAAAAGPDP